jgi:hypothetical protein
MLGGAGSCRHGTYRRKEASQMSMATTTTHTPERPFWPTPEVWPSLAIATMWLAVVLDALFGPDIVTSSAAGSDTARVPTAVAVAFFAFLATWVLARHAFAPAPAADRS